MPEVARTELLALPSDPGQASKANSSTRSSLLANRGEDTQKVGVNGLFLIETAGRGVA